MKAALVYWSKSGNTEKVSKAIRQGLLDEEVDVSYWKLDETEEHSFLDYDLYCIGFPSYSWHTPELVQLSFVLPSLGEPETIHEYLRDLKKLAPEIKKIKDKVEEEKRTRLKRNFPYLLDPDVYKNTSRSPNILRNVKFLFVEFFSSIMRNAKYAFLTLNHLFSWTLHYTKYLTVEWIHVLNLHYYAKRKISEHQIVHALDTW